MLSTIAYISSCAVNHSSATKLPVVSVLLLVLNKKIDVSSSETSSSVHVSRVSKATCKQGTASLTTSKQRIQTYHYKELNSNYHKSFVPEI